MSFKMIWFLRLWLIECCVIRVYNYIDLLQPVKFIFSSFSSLSLKHCGLRLIDNIWQFGVAWAAVVRKTFNVNFPNRIYILLSKYYDIHGKVFYGTWYYFLISLPASFQNFQQLKVQYFSHFATFRSKYYSMLQLAVVHKIFSKNLHGWILNLVFMFWILGF